METLCFCEILRAKLAKLKEERPPKAWCYSEPLASCHSELASYLSLQALCLLSLRAERGNPKKAKLKNQKAK